MMTRCLGRFETAQTLSGEYAPFNAVGVLRLEGGPTPERMRLAWESLREKHPLLQVRVRTKGRNYLIVQDAPLPLPCRFSEARTKPPGWGSQRKNSTAASTFRPGRSFAASIFIHPAMRPRT